MIYIKIFIAIVIIVISICLIVKYIREKKISDLLISIVLPLLMFFYPLIPNEFPHMSLLDTLDNSTQESIQQQSTRTTSTSQTSPSLETEVFSTVDKAFYEDNSIMQDPIVEPILVEIKIPYGAKEHNNNWYYIYSGCITWLEAKLYCENRGGHLATITTKEEDVFVYKYLSSIGINNVYFGLFYSDSERIWKWVNNEEFLYTNWQDDSNSIDKRKYYAKYTSDRWIVDVYDNANNYFICEWDNSSNTNFVFTDSYNFEENTYKKYYNGHTYALYDISTTWHEAKKICEKNDGYLATITSLEEQSFVEELLLHGEKKHYWLGGTRENGKWEWITGETWNFTNWSIGQPDNSHFQNLIEDYLQIINENFKKQELNKWNDIFFNAIYPNEEFFNHFLQSGFLCEWDYIIE